MILKKTALFIILFMFVSMSKSFSLGFEKLYIDGEIYMGEFIVDLDEIYLPEKNTEDILRKESIKWDSSTLSVILNERTIPARIMTYKGKVYYPFLSICRELFFPAEWNYKSKIISIKLTPVNPQIQSSDDEDRYKNKRRKRGLTISVFNEDFIKNVMESVVAVRIHADVRNSYARDVKKIEAECVFLYPDGVVHYTDKVMLENLKGGESRRVFFYTSNPSEVQTLKYKLSVREIRE